ncbi:MAG: hypothetical protein EBU88_05640 [Acidobacteria bacterium]|nr:hypothetical protein [Acidobacteriota bacterium]
MDRLYTERIHPNHKNNKLWWTPKTGPRVELPCGVFEGGRIGRICMKKSPRAHTTAFKAQVVLAALKGD